MTSYNNMGGLSKLDGRKTSQQFPVHNDLENIENRAANHNNISLDEAMIIRK